MVQHIDLVVREARLELQEDVHKMNSARTSKLVNVDTTLLYSRLTHVSP